MATVRTNRSIRRRIEIEYQKQNYPKLPATAEVGRTDRRIVVPGDPANAWNGALVPKETFAALLNVAGGVGE